MKTSKELSKKIAKGMKQLNIELESEYFRIGDSEDIMTKQYERENLTFDYNKIKSYDIIYDICIKHAKEFFGKDLGYSSIYIDNILSMLQQNKTQDEIEKYLWEHTLFNPKKKI